MSNKQVIDTDLNKLASLVNSESVNKVVHSLLNAKASIESGLVVMYHNIPEEVRAMLPWPGTDAKTGALGNRPMDVVKTPRLNSEGERVETPQSTFKTIFYASEDGQAIAKRLGELPTKNLTGPEAAEKATLKAKVNYGSALFKKVAWVDIRLAQLQALDFIDYNWIVDGKDNVVRSKVPLRLFAVQTKEEMKAKKAPKDKFISLDFLIRLDPTMEAINAAKGDTLFDKLMATAKGKAPTQTDGDAKRITNVAQADGAMGDLVAFFDNPDNFKAMLAVKDEETLRNINSLIDFLGSLEGDDEFNKRLADAAAAMQKAKAPAKVAA